ncbi:Crp/Fnr family transcriptional regulator [Candidatus Saccharibacteria bacterium CPR2]|nr:Crp/Fnr family transcriptional regulator [Candidatus Saccharibacteria bacterium CPR2]
MKKEYPVFFREGQVRRYGKGQILLYQGEKTNDIFLIKKGYVKVYDITKSGNEKLLMLLGECDILPQIMTFGKNEPLLYFYESHSDVELLALKQSALIDEINKNHETAKIYLRYYINQARILMSRIECLEASVTKVKIGLVLMYLVKAHGKKKLMAKSNISTILPQITHQTIANMAGVTRETASLQMKKLEKEKIIRNNKNKNLEVNCSKLKKLLNK